MGSVSTTATANWTVVKDASGFPTVVTGDDVKVFVNNSTPPFGGEAWSDIDLMDAIPDGATITNLTFSLTVQVDGSRTSPAIAIAPSIQFIDKAQYLADDFLAGYGGYGAGTVGDLPDDNDSHDLTYDNSEYGAPPLVSGGVPDMAALAAALSDASTPVILRAQAPQNATTGSGITYSAPLTLTFTYTVPDLTPCDTTVDLDLSTAVFLDNSGTLSGQYVDGVICTTTDNLFPDFYFPGLVLDSTKAYLVTVTFDPDSAHSGGTNREVYVAGVQPGQEQDDVDAAFTAGGEYEGVVPVLWDTGFSTSGDVQTFTIGPGRGPGPVTADVGDLPSWDDATIGVGQGYTAPWFETDVQGAVSAISIRKICTVGAPPLRLYPRSDGRGMSSARRMRPPSPTVQASNRRGPSAIL